MKLFGKKEFNEDKYNLYMRNRLREAREEKQLTQEELARKIFWSRVKLSDLERGRTQINTTDLLTLSSALEKPVAHFFPGQTAKEGELSAKELELVMYFRGIENEAMEDLLIKQAKQFADAAYEARIKEHSREKDLEDLPKKKKK